MKKILIADDEMQTIELLKRRLELIGYQVIPAGDGGEAIEKIRAELPSLILLDVSMPVFDGNQVCTILKEDDTTKNIPIVMVTGDVTVAGMEDSMKAGADDYITKPYKWDELVAKIKKFVPET